VTGNSCCGWPGDQRRGEGLRRSAEGQRQIARLEKQMSHGMITRPSGYILGVY